MSRRLFIFLAATELTLTGCMPEFDLRINVFNGTSQQIESCNSTMTYCEKTAPGETMTAIYATNGRAAELYGEWLVEWSVKLCGRTIPFKDAFEIKGVDREFWSKKTTYNLAVRNDVVTQACSGGSAPETPSASK